MGDALRAYYPSSAMQPSIGARHPVISNATHGSLLPPRGGESDLAALVRAILVALRSPHLCQLRHLVSFRAGVGNRDKLVSAGALHVAPAHRSVPRAARLGRGRGNAPARRAGPCGRHPGRQAGLQTNGREIEFSWRRFPRQLCLATLCRAYLKHVPRHTGGSENNERRQ